MEVELSLVNSGRGRFCVGQLVECKAVIDTEAVVVRGCISCITLDHVVFKNVIVDGVEGDKSFIVQVKDIVKDSMSIVI